MTPKEHATMTTDETARLRQLADTRLAQIGAEPASAVLAIITEGEPDPTAGSSDTSTWNHHSVAEFRRQLVRAAEAYGREREEYFEQVHAQEPKDTPRVLLDAYAGTMMAGSYAYTLAAVLGLAEREFGPQTARRLADAADCILTDGDDEDMNADVRGEVPLPPPTPAEQKAAGQMELAEVTP